MPPFPLSVISPATAFLLKFSTGGVCEHCGGHCTCDHLELHHLPGRIAPVQENNYLIVCRACHWYIHAMMVPAPQQQVLAEQRSPARKRIFRTILRGQKIQGIPPYRNPLRFLWSESSRYPPTKTRLQVN